MLLNTYVTDAEHRADTVAAVRIIPFIQKRAQFCFKWIDSISEVTEIRTDDQMRSFLLNLVCFAACIEGLFFFAAFAYVYYLRSCGLLQGFATGTSWVFRDESAHIEFALQVIDTARLGRPELFDESFNQRVVDMIREAVDCELSFAKDTLSMGVTGLSIASMREYLQYVADRRLEALQIKPIFGSRNPFDFMELQDV